MRRSKYRRASTKSGWFSGRRRIIAVAATLVAFGGIVTVTQVSNASTQRTQKKALSACDNVQAPAPAKLSTKTRKGTWTDNNGTVVQHADDGAGDTVTTAQLRERCRRWVMNNMGNNGNNNGGNNGNNGGAATSAPAATATASAGTNAGGNGQAGNGQAGNGPVPVDGQMLAAASSNGNVPGVSTTVILLVLAAALVAGVITTMRIFRAR
jgi:hypothetical protein